MLKYTFGAAAAILLMVYLSSSLKMPKTSLVEEDDDVEEKVIKKSKRKPASLNKTVETESGKNPPMPSISTSSRNATQFDSEVTEGGYSAGEAPYAGGAMAMGDSGSASSYGYGSGGSGDSGRSPSSSNSNNSRGDSKGRSGGDGSSNTAGNSSSIGGVGGAGAFVENPFAQPGSTTNRDDRSDDRNSNVDSGVPVDTDALVCSGNLGGGAYSNPIGVTLSCSRSAQIKYCLSDNGCCDPMTNGRSYSSRLVVGRTDGNYCLSFYGKGGGKESELVQLTFTINRRLPNLQVSHPRVFYQTTELHGMSHIASNDFGKANFALGQFNLRSRNPDPEGDDYNCEEVVTNYVMLRDPTPFTIMDIYGVEGLSILSQLDIPLIKDHLDYGDNYVVSYMVDNNHAAPMYSCSSRKITLRDFEYYQTGATLPVNGVADPSGFSGGFTAYGFFEEDQIYRGPAGISTEEQSGHELKAGLYGVFY